MRVLEIILSIIRFWKLQHHNTCIYSDVKSKHYCMWTNIDHNIYQKSISKIVVNFFFFFERCNFTFNLLFWCGKSCVLSTLRTNTEFDDTVIAYQCVEQQVKISPRINRKLLLPWRIASKWYMKFLLVFLPGNPFILLQQLLFGSMNKDMGLSTLLFRHGELLLIGQIIVNWPPARLWRIIARN